MPLRDDDLRPMTPEEVAWVRAQRVPGIEPEECKVHIWLDQLIGYSVKRWQRHNAGPGPISEGRPRVGVGHGPPLWPAPPTADDESGPQGRQ